MLFDGPSRKCKVNTEVECDNRPCDDPDHCMQETPTSTTESTTSMTTTEAGDTTTTSAECVNTFPPGQKCPNHATVNFADINDCSRYWHCEGGCASNVQCEMGMLFNPVSRKCEDSSTVDCDYRHCSDPARCPCVNFDEPGQFYCDGKVNGTTLFPDMTDCASYLNCTSGCMEPILCQENYLYHKDREWCSNPWEIDCGMRPCNETLYPDRC